MTENKPERKPILYSGIQPTGDLNLGTYIGAVHNWLKIQDDYLSIYGIADLHALTVRRNPQEFRKTAWSLFAQYVACGLDPEKSILYFQSHVHQHAELSWILGCYTYIGELQRMTQYKDKSAQHSDNLNIGLLDYPVLMAADILLIVPYLMLKNRLNLKLSVFKVSIQMQEQLRIFSHTQTPMHLLKSLKLFMKQRFHNHIS